MRFDIISIFPEFFASFKSEALIARAQAKNLITIDAHNLRDWTTDNHKTVDDRPYGGGAGMVLKIEPIMQAVQSLISNFKFQKSKLRRRIVLFSPKGKKFDQAMARKWAKLDQLILICGRYEGVDERVAQYIADEEVSIGDYVLFGGEVPAMVVMEAVTRLIPGAVAKQESIDNESFRPLSKIEKTMMEKFVEYPHYTRPEDVTIAGKKRKVPKVLLSGDHKKVEQWRKEHSK